jgi:solute:Na+ symporter, SSS family
MPSDRISIFQPMKQTWFAAHAAWICATLLFMLLHPATTNCDDSAPRLGPEERQRLLEEIRAGVRENTGWDRIRAAEALAELGHPEEAAAALRDQVETAPPEERIGVWRTLARAASTPEARRQMTDRIRAVFADVNAPDRIHAVESMAKLRVQITAAERTLAQAMTSGTSAAAVFPRWLLALSGDAAARRALVVALQDTDPVTRLRAAYSISHLDGTLSADEAAALKNASLAEPKDAPYRAWMIGAAWKHSNRLQDRALLSQLLAEYIRSSDAAQRLQAVNCVADGGTAMDLPLLAGVKADPDPLIRRAVAIAVLRFDQQRARAAAPKKPNL